MEELLRDSGFRSYLTSTQPQQQQPQQQGKAAGAGASAATGRVPLVAPAGGGGGGGGRQLVPLLPNHPGPRFGLSPGSWQVSGDTLVC